MKTHVMLYRVLPLLCLPLLAGCSGLLLGGGNKDSLFRFGIAAPVDAVPASARTVRPLVLSRIRFASEIEGDRILTSRGNAMLYIKDARWVTSAPDLFAQAMANQFSRRAPDIRLLSQRSGGAGVATLQVSIDRFEARYAPTDPANIAPMILVSGDVTLLEPGGKQPIQSRHFTEQEPADENSRAAITEAFDRASQRFTAAMVDWTSQSLPDIPSN